MDIIKQANKFVVFFWVVVCLFSFGGCATTTPSVEELLRAPILANDYSTLQLALNSQFDSAVQLKYPTEGELLSPFAFGDWDGDGTDEAVALFTTTDTTTVQVGILSPGAQGAWTLAGMADGLSDTVTSIAFARMQAGTTEQIVVTFQAQGQQYLAVYAYQNGVLHTVFNQPYQQYLIENLTGMGTDDLILMNSDENGALQMDLLTFGSEGFVRTAIPSFLEEPFTSYAHITASVGRTGRRYLIVDGFVGDGQTTLASEILWYNANTSAFEETTLAGTKDLYNASKRYSADLLSFDIDVDGAVEIPVPYNTQKDGTLNYVKNSAMNLVSWCDFTSVKSEKSYGLYDSVYHYYIALPEELKGNLMILDGEDDNSIEVCNLSGDVLYFALRVVDFEEDSKGWYQIGTVASKRIQVKLGEGVSSFLTLYMLSQSLYLL